jgi:small-conductance mechanosensitive channel
MSKVMPAANSSTPVSTSTVQSVVPTPDEAPPISSASKVKFSVLGELISSAKGKEANKSKSNEDIENSNLPKTVKDLLKRIRELQEQIREQEQKRSAIMSDQSLSAEQKQEQLRQIQAMISSLNGALSSAMSQLNKAMDEQSFTKDQQASVVSLLSL